MSSKTDKERIRSKIRKCKSEIEKYTEYQFKLRYSLDYCEQAQSGIKMLMNEQYEKVKSDCTEAIGEEPDLLSSLQVKHISIPDVCTSIHASIQNGLSGIQNKIDDLREELQRLYDQL